MSKVQQLIKTSIFVASVSLLAACTHKNTMDVNIPLSEKINPDRDPLRPLNKAIFVFNTQFDTLLGKPAAGLYRGIFPAPVRNRFRDAFQNLREPNNFANALFKGQFKAASLSLVRFMLNSTFGIAGLYDLCGHLNIPYKRHDFGQTLASWGVQNGPYLMLPFRGPSNFRDGLGRAVDYFMDPLNIILMSNDHSAWTLARDIPEGIDDRSRYIEELDDFKRGALDYYASVRSAYFQNREGWTHGKSGNPASTTTYDSLYSEDKEERRKTATLSLPNVVHKPVHDVPAQTGSVHSQTKNHNVVHKAHHPVHAQKSDSIKNHHKPFMHNNKSAIKNVESQQVKE